MKVKLLTNGGYGLAEIKFPVVVEVPDDLVSDVIIKVPGHVLISLGAAADELDPLLNYAWYTYDEAEVIHEG